MYFLTPKVFGFKGDKEAYWKNFDWPKAVEAGTKASGLDFSGEYGFAPTIMYWRINPYGPLPKNRLWVASSVTATTAGWTGKGSATRAIRSETPNMHGPSNTAQS